MQNSVLCFHWYGEKDKMEYIDIAVYCFPVNTQYLESCTEPGNTVASREGYRGLGLGGRHFYVKFFVLFEFLTMQSD